MGMSMRRAIQAASIRAKSLSTQVRIRSAPDSLPKPTSATSQLWNSHRVSGNVDDKERDKVSALGRPQSVARKNTERERLESSILSKSITLTDPAPSSPRFLTTSLPIAPAPTTTNLIFEMVLLGRRVLAVWTYLSRKLLESRRPSRSGNVFI